MTCVVVDDDDDIVDMLATLLGRYGVHVVRTRTVADAVAYVDTAPHQSPQLSPTPSRHLYMNMAARTPGRWSWRRFGVADHSGEHPA